MRKLLNDYKAMAFLSGILAVIACDYVNFLPGWICFVPLFIVLQTRSRKEYFKAGFIFGLTIAIPSFFWMVTGAERFTGSATIYGYVVFIISSLFLSLYFGCINYCFNILKTQNNNSFSFLINALLIACIYVIGETLLMYFSTTLPWFAFHSGSSLMNSIYAIQPASYVGIHGLSFIVVFVNYLIANCIVRKQWIKLLLSNAVVLAYMLFGFWLYKSFENNTSQNDTDKKAIQVSFRGFRSVQLAILNQNVPPEIKWNDKTGNALVEKLLDLNKTAAAQKPNIILWSESAVPWTYRADDDFVKEIMKISTPANITNILGINTDYKENKIYNSAYCLLPDGKVAGRYDKRIPLSFIEEPAAGIIFPFLSSEGFIVKRGENNEPLNTPYGKAGVMICNESSVPSAASSVTKNGAQFLVNISNDGWFNNTYLVNLHFYNVRMRAVETRKDIAVNSNTGFSGLIKASGEIAIQERSDEPYVKTVSITPNNIITPAVTMPRLLVYVCIACILFFIAKRVTNNSNKKKNVEHTSKQSSTVLQKLVKKKKKLAFAPSTASVRK